MSRSIGTRPRTIVTMSRIRRVSHRRADGFRPSMVEALPDPARRWLTRAIEPGTILAASAELRMRGSILLRPGAAPFVMRATEFITPRKEFLWRATVQRGALRISGYDRYVAGRGATSWRLWHLVPVAKASGRDVDRSAAGRLAGESILVPSALVGADWRPVDGDRATAVIRIEGSAEDAALTIRVDPDGRLESMVFPRWNADPTNGPIGYLPFGIDRIDEAKFNGYTIPARFRAGWRLGQVDEFAFFEADVHEARFHAPEVRG